MQAATYGDVVVTPHNLATSAALEVLATGGNAVDAAIAANAVQGVVAPETCGIGGDLFALVWLPGSDAPHALNASGRAGSGANPDALAGHESIPIDHPQAVTVPGCVDGWHALADRFGSRPLREIVAPAVRLASEGFPASTEFVLAFGARREQLMGQPATNGFYRDGEPVPWGTLIERPELAESLEAAGESRSAFYEGAAGEAVSEAVGGLITADDLAQPQADWVDPLRTDVFGTTGWTIPPNSQGYLALAALRILELTDGDPGDVHRQIESYLAAACSRDTVLAEQSPLSSSELVADERLAQLAEQVDPDRAQTWPAWKPLPGGTAYHCVVDRSGMAVSFIQSNYHGIGSGIGAGHAGFLLHDRGAGFTLEPGHPNQLSPGRRPAHTLSPTLWTSDGRLRMVLGTRGGDAQPQLLVRVGAAVLAGLASPSEAQALPRWIVRRFGADQRPEVVVEPQLGHTAESLRGKGHHVEVVDAPQPGWGPVALVTVDDDGLRVGAPDPRVDTASVGVA